LKNKNQQPALPIALVANITRIHRCTITDTQKLCYRNIANINILANISYPYKQMNYPAASRRGINRDKLLIAASSGVLNSFIPIRFAIGILST